jgi:5-methylcytosine-specific restriction endonuclease McrA
VITLVSQPSKNPQVQKIHKSSKIEPASKPNPAFEKAKKKLEALSDKKLLSDLENLNHKERNLKVSVLLYLSELEMRKLYLPLGFSSLFDFCTYHLGYTRATATRRIRSARAAAKYPHALAMLASGELNITTLSMISDILDQDNHEEILSKIKNKSTREVELLVSRHRPVRVSRDSVRPICVMRRILESEPACCGTENNISGSSAETDLLDQDLTGVDGRRKSNKISSSAETKILNQEPTRGGERCKSNKISSSAGTRLSAGSPPEKIILEQRLKLGFTVSPEFMKKFNKIKSLLSSKHPEGINFEMLFDIVMTEYLERRDPAKRRKRRAKLASNRDKTRKCGCKTKIKESGRTSRHISPAVRDQVYTRDKGRCAFVGANGTRCNSTWDLEIDHVVPFARGGDNSPGNLRLLCRKHNIHQAEKTYGREFMNKYIKNK